MIKSPLPTLSFQIIIHSCIPPTPIISLVSTMRSSSGPVCQPLCLHLYHLYLRCLLFPLRLHPHLQYRLRGLLPHLNSQSSRRSEPLEPLLMPVEDFLLIFPRSVFLEQELIKSLLPTLACRLPERTRFLSPRERTVGQIEVDTHCRRCWGGNRKYIRRLRCVSYSLFISQLIHRQTFAAKTVRELLPSNVPFTLQDSNKLDAVRAKVCCHSLLPCTISNANSRYSNNFPLSVAMRIIGLSMTLSEVQ